MPRIPPKYIDSTFYLYQDRLAAEKGENFGGTGFIVAVKSKGRPDVGYLYGVTNWHVAVQGGFSTVRLNTLDGNTDVIERGPEEWRFKPGGPEHDIAIVPLYVKKEIHKFECILTDDFLTKEKLEKHQIGVGDDVFMIGRFIDHDGEQTNIPAVRFGNISMMPAPIQQPTGYRGESFCLDLHSRSGYSGSPVFVYRTPGNDLENLGHMTIGGEPLFLLGIHWGQFPEYWKIGTQELSDAEAMAGMIRTGEYIKGLSGMTSVIPAWEILNLLNSEEFEQEREEWDEIAKKN